MITVIIATIVVAVLVWFLTEGDKWMTFLGAILGIVVGVLIATGLATGWPTEEYVSSTQQLHNLYDDSSLEGSFFLGIGSFEGEEYIYYNVLLDNGLIDPERISKYDPSVFIAEDGGGNPRLEVVCTRLVIDERMVLWGLPFDEEKCKYVFHIPEGSVDTGFRVK